jgi:hypothetical protein
LFIALLASSEHHLAVARAHVQTLYGPIDLAGCPFPFSFTTYYNEEMGDTIIRQFASFEAPFDPGRLRAIKQETMGIEARMCSGDKRRANLDPGYVNLSTVVLATTKDASYRVYLGDRVYAQPTLFFRKGGFQPFEWTYPDYRQPEALSFFYEVRERLKGQLREAAATSAR